MFVVYSPEGRNRIGHDARGPSRVNPVPQADFSETMMELDKEAAEEMGRHQKADYALGQYQKQLDTMQDRHVVVLVNEIMSTPVLSLSADASIKQAWDIMQTRRIQHIPVVEDDQLIGICSSQELLRYIIVNEANQVQTPSDLALIEVAKKEVITTLPNVDVRRVAFVMSQYRIGSLPVMSETGQMIGIVTRSDLIKRLAKLPPLEIYA